ncbi:MAG: hypothetical protein UU25_C0035G0005 [Microgenomates group bacterium GW2011_GWB1_40_9]|nr:MAG: hypothetical protein UU25_C0035G0005 [Microgenomates group bacterium GW2011_GWB1_40_9]
MKKQKSMKGIGAIVMVVAVGILVAVSVVGVIIQKKGINDRIQKQVSETSTVAETIIEDKPSPTVTTKPVTASSSTDAKLEEDFSDIDASMNAINTDASAIDAGLNDQMGDLSE